MICKNCGKELANKNNKFCGQSCAATFNNKQRKGYKSKTFICLNCAKEKIVEKNCKGKFCNNKCQGKYRERETYKRFLAGNVDVCSTIKRILVEHNGYKCSSCDKTTWLNKPIPLEVEHIDGNSENNMPSNLTLICPNCHTFTPTYKGKNKGNGRHVRRKRYQEGKSY